MDGTLVAPPRGLSFRRHANETVMLATPLAVAQLAQMAMGVTDTVFLGGLGAEALAAGGLGTMLYITVAILLQGVMTAVSIRVAQAQGAGHGAAVPEIYWTGVALTGLLIVPAFMLFSAAERLLLLVGEPAALAHDTGRFLDVMRWQVPASLVAVGLMRAFLPAIGRGSFLLWTSLGSAVVNAVLCWALIYGRLGLPALGFLGAAWASVIVMSGAAVVLLSLLHGPASLRRFVAWRRPSLREFTTLLRLGLPVTATFAVETWLFLAVGLMIGMMGQAALAAHQIGMTVISVSFMIPLALAQAANVRVGRCTGAGDRAGARRAGLVAIGLGAGAEAVAAGALLFAPHILVGWFVDGTQAEVTAIAVGLLAVGAVFQVADGVQSVAAGALRGLGDTRVPFLMAAAGYWGLGFPAAWLLGWHLGWGAGGAWCGLAAGLMAVAILLTRRFMQRTR